MRAMMILGTLGLGVILGCGYEPAAPPPAAPGNPQTATAPAPKPAPAPVQPSAPAQSGMTTNMAAASAAAGVAPLDLMGGPQGVQPAKSAQPAPSPGPNLEKAQAGVGKQGRDYGGGAIMAPITVPVRTYFQARDRITFDIQVADAMRLYKATNGSAPKSHEEFMEKIIKENQIKLPALPPGDRYVYIPEQEQLCVEHTQRQ